MINIIRTPQSPEALAEIFAKYPVTPLLPPLGDPAWQRAKQTSLGAKWTAEVRALAVSLLDVPLATLTPELYADFYATGRRLPFERVYFERRRQLAVAVMAALLESEPAVQKKLLASALIKARDVFDEVSWSLPAHVWTQPSGVDPMMLDLFASETANLCGELIALLGPVMPADFKRDIQARLRTTVFDKYLSTDFSWMNATHNWNAVCHQGILGAALGVCDDPALLGKLFARGAKGLAMFLSGFASDGGSSEGPGYWGYGFGWFTELNQQLEARTHGELSLFEGDEHVRAIAAFGPRMTLSNGMSVNFSDNSPNSAPRPALLQYLADRLKDDFVASHAAIAWRRSEDMNFGEQRADVFHLTRRFLRCPNHVDPSAQLPASDTYLPALGVIITRFRDGRGRLWEFAAKAGHNAEHHNHNDLGSILLNIDGQRVLTEIGAPEYNRAFFSSKRYESIAARSLGHAVPLINGEEQPAGAEFTAKVMRQSFTPERVEFNVDLTGAYAASAGCKKCERAISIDRRAGVLQVTDTFDLDRTDSLETAIVTESPATSTAGQATIAAGAVTLQITPAQHCMVAEVQAHTFSNHHGKPSPMNRIVIKPEKVQSKVSIGYTAKIL